MKELAVVDLFAGIGGFSYGLHNASPMFKTVAFAEIDQFCQKVLKKNFGNVKIYEDIRDVRIEPPVFLVCGGFPCQGFSHAGLQRGTKDNRYLWPEMFDVIKYTKPRWVIAENVRGIVNVEDGMAFNKVHTDLESEGYEVQAFNIPAAAKGAWHRRERIWFVACNPDVVYPHDFRCEQHTEAEEKGNGRAEATSFSGSSHVPNSDNNGLEQKRPIEECNEADAGKDTPNQQSANSSYSVRENDDGGDTQRPKYDGEIQRGRDDEKNNVAGEKGVRQLSENADYKKESGRDNGATQDSSGTLVSDRQVSELSLNRGLEQDESSLQENKVQQGNDTHSKHRVEDATNSKSIGHGGGNSKERGTEQRKFQQKEQTRNEMGSETEGCGELSGEERNVSDSKVEGLEGHDEHRSTVSGKDEKSHTGNKSGGTKIEDAADTECIGHTEVQTQGKHTSGKVSTGNGKEGGTSDVWYSQGTGYESRTNGQGKEEHGGASPPGEQCQGDWSEIIAQFRGVPNGVSTQLDKTRTNRLKSLGNAIIPQIAEEIGRAIIKAELRNERL